MKEYYYLHKADKIGPILEEDLLKLNLNSDTLIWEESFENWTKLSDIPELNKKVPPPPPKEYLEKNRKKSNKVKYSFLTFLILLVLSSIISYFVINTKITQSNNNLKSKIESVLGGKSIIYDGTNYSVEGNLERNYIKNEPKKETDGLDFSALKYPSSVRWDNELWTKFKNRGYFDYYTCNRGGFDIKKITKIDNGYEFEHISSKDMVYTSNIQYRPTVQSSYNDSYEYLIESDIDFYQKGAFSIIDNFPNLRSEYHFLDNVVKPSYPHAIGWSSDSYVYNDYRRVFYHIDNKYYEIALSEYRLKDLIQKIVIIAGSIVLAIFLGLLVINPFKW